MYDEYFLPKSEFLKVTVDMFGDFWWDAWSLMFITGNMVFVLVDYS